MLEPVLEVESDMNFNRIKVNQNISVPEMFMTELYPMDLHPMDDLVRLSENISSGLSKNM